MLTSANQYLRPEYLPPMQTTLDAKQSPLAMLAKTCSQIGADPPSKPLLASLEKSSKSKPSDTREKSSPTAPVEPAKSSFKPYESCLGRDKASSPEDQQRAASSHSASGRSRTPGSKRCSSNQSASSRAMTPQGRKTATPNGSDQPTRESPASRTSASGTIAMDAASTRASSSPQQSKSTYSPSVLSMDPALKDMPLGFKPTTIPTSVATSIGYLGYPPQLPIDVMANSLVSQHHAALKSGLAGNPYLSYARMKTATGADTLVPVCRDPYCTGCQLNSHLLAGSAPSNGKIPSTPSTPTTSCPAGCAQCDHKTSVASPYGPMGVHSTAAAYAHAQLAALAAASQLPFVCNWIAGDTAYCGKRFSSSEELLQHLRSHTSVSANDPVAAAQALSLLTPQGLPPTHPLLSRTYPTPPLSPLATARYHPYGKPSPLLPHSLSSLGLGFPPSHAHSAAAAAAAAGLPPYFSPYSLYGSPRLGAASGMHP